ncbi:hypothetical protein [Streptomyces sp. NBC_01506]|uniref:hypothetical protein n=1 Tax=Streptomyces sp. NBC_01506 TaxID=2903887 RepID=UPI00386F43C4
MELTADAATHGRLSAWDFPLEPQTAKGGGALRIEATDTRGHRLPGHNPQLPPPDDESGRGLLGVWAELDVVGNPSPSRVNLPN